MHRLHGLTRARLCVSKPQAGAAVLEVLIAGVMLAIALIGHVSSTVAEHKLNEVQRARREALTATKQFVERLRSDEDWGGLYARLRLLQENAVAAGAGPRLNDGRRAWFPTAYYADFVPPGDLGELRVLVDVPAAPLAVDPTGPTKLREDLNLVRFGLPADLNGDGVVDGEARGGDYAVLPVSITFRWVPTGKAPAELRVDTWIRGNR